MLNKLVKFYWKVVKDGVFDSIHLVRVEKLDEIGIRGKYTVFRYSDGSKKEIPECWEENSLVGLFKWEDMKKIEVVKE